MYTNQNKLKSFYVNKFKVEINVLASKTNEVNYNRNFILVTIDRHSGRL